MSLHPTAVPVGELARGFVKVAQRLAEVSGAHGDASQSLVARRAAGDGWSLGFACGPRAACGLVVPGS